MSRNRYVVCYDVREPKRLRRMHRTMLGYGDPLQYSVFVCDLSATERILMEDAVRQVVRLSEDSVVVIDLGPAEGVARRRIRQLGEKRLVERDRCVVV
ncbi:MAG: CRISPR-associated endonuclease Cas2 [Armatimonadota bacterium]|nr:CRISPR-associated endonuclease Cas2 [Armatimonadota bacterium]